MKFLVFIVLVLTAVTAVKCDVFKCPNPEVMKNFSLTESLGKWYIIKETKGVINRVCPSLVIKEGGEERTLSILLKVKNLIWNKLDYTKVTAKVNPDENAKIVVKFGTLGGLIRITGNYSVIDTDYKNYAIVWGCNKILGIPNESVFILGRKNILNDEIIHNALDLLDDLKLNRQRLDTTIQDGCFDM